jgi:hypothetical protein
MTAVYPLLLAVAVQPAAPLELLNQVREHYLSLHSYSARIVEQETSGFGIGGFSQTLRWRRGGRFELRVTSEYQPNIPDLYGDGRYVLLIWPGNLWRAENLVPGPGQSAVWEQYGGPMLGWMENTPVSPRYFELSEAIPHEWSYGPRALWQGQAVCELRRTVRRAPEFNLSLFVDPKNKLFVGWEAPTTTRLISDQVLNPALPENLGDSPVEETAP